METGNSKISIRFQSYVTIDILVNLDGKHCQDKLCMFGEKENKKMNVLHGKMYFS
jgi:hypothetical protein